MRNKHRRNFLKLVPGLILVIVLIINAIIQEKTVSRRNEILLNSFQEIKKSNSIVGTIKEIYHFPKIRSSETMILVAIDNNKKYKISTILNLSQKNDERSISDVAELGDKILKRVQSDTIYINKGVLDSEEVYFFILDILK
jgi:hypothetical protein